MTVHPFRLGWTHPNDNSSRLVGGSNNEVRAFADMVKQEIEKILGLLILESNNVANEPSVDVECFLTSDGMLTDERVLCATTISQLTSLEVNICTAPQFRLAPFGQVRRVV